MTLLVAEPNSTYTYSIRHEQAIRVDLRLQVNTQAVQQVLDTSVLFTQQAARCTAPAPV